MPPLYDTFLITLLDFSQTYKQQIIVLIDFIYVSVIQKTFCSGPLITFFMKNSYFHETNKSGIVLYFLQISLISGLIEGSWILLSATNLLCYHAFFNLWKTPEFHSQ